MSYLAIASGCDLVSFVWTRAGNPPRQSGAAENAFRLPEDWKPIRLVIEIGRAESSDLLEQDPERWDGMA